MMYQIYEQSIVFKITVLCTGISDRGETMCPCQLERMKGHAHIFANVQFGLEATVYC